MKLRAALVLLLVLSVSSFAQEAGFWRASSSNARAITGDIAVSDTRLTLDMYNFPAAKIRDLTRDEMLALFSLDNPAGAVGHLYKLEIPSSRRFLHKNTLCGSDDTQWMATTIDGRSLHVAFFSSKASPTFTMDALQNSADLCGNFSYSR